MSVVAILEIRFQSGQAQTGLETLEKILIDTRAFDGCLGVQVIQDVNDSEHVIAVERWESEAHDAAYRKWRASEQGASELGPLLAGPPALTVCRPVSGA